MNSGSRFVNVPYALLHDPGLDFNAKLVWVVLAAHCNRPPRFHDAMQLRIARSIVLSRSEPDMSAKRIWVALASCADERGLCRVTSPTLARTADISADAVRPAIDLLSNSGSCNGLKLEWLA